MEKMMNNTVVVRGTVVSAPVYSHEVFGEKFYRMVLGMKRRSGVEDRVPVLVSERLWDVNGDHLGEYVKVEGQYRSQNRDVAGKHRLLLDVFAKKICTELSEEYENDENQISLNGFLCKPPVLKRTPSGKAICDIVLAVNREFRHSDYIPCILWGPNAVAIAQMQVGDRIRLVGRIQSREYGKKSDGGIETRVAYEVSVTVFEEVKEKEVMYDAGMARAV